MGKVKKVLILSAVIIIIAALAVLLSYRFMGSIFSSDMATPESASSTGGREIGPYQSLGEYLVNTSGNLSYQFIKASIVVEVDDKKVLTELEERDPQIRDIIISLLSEENPVDPEESPGDVIKGKIREALNGILLEGKITSVWFTEFVVQ